MNTGYIIEVKWKPLMEFYNWLISNISSIRKFSSNFRISEGMINAPRLLRLKPFHFPFFLVLSMLAFSPYLIIFQQANSQGPLTTTSDSDMIENESSSVDNNNSDSNLTGTLRITLGNTTYELTDVAGLFNSSAVFVIDVQSLNLANTTSGETNNEANKNNLTQIDTKEVMFPGDILMRIDNISIARTDDIISALETKKPGEKMNLTLIRNGNVEYRTITSGATAEDNQPNFIEAFSGIYTNPEAGLQMNLPPGWTGFKWAGTIDFGIAGPDIVNLTDIDKQNVSITFSIADLPFLQNITSQMNTNSTSNLSADSTQNLGECNTLSESFGSLNNTIVTLDSVNECNISGNYSKSRSSLLATDQDLITIAFSANSAELYNANLAQFNQSLATLKVDNPIDVRTVLADIFGGGGGTNNNQTAAGPFTDLFGGGGTNNNQTAAGPLTGLFGGGDTQ